MGEGFTWETQDRERDIAAARAAWERAKALIRDDRHRLVLLDELNIVLRYDYLPVDEVVAFLRDEKPADKHVVVTGRNAHAGADRDRRPRHRDDAGQASVPPGREGAEGYRVLVSALTPALMIQGDRLATSASRPWSRACAARWCGAA